MRDKKGGRNPQVPNKMSFSLRDSEGRELLNSLRRYFRNCGVRAANPHRPGPPKRLAERVYFAVWMAEPVKKRWPRAQYELAELLGVTTQSLWLWQREPEVQALIESELRRIGRSKLPGIIRAIGNKAEQEGDVSAARLIFEHAHGRFDRDGDTPATTINIGPQILDDDDNAPPPSWVQEQLAQEEAERAGRADEHGDN